MSLAVTTSIASDEERSRNRPAVVSQYHSALAMHAARQMRSSRQKLKTGRQVCHHLRMMLAEPLAEPANDPAIQQSEPQFQLGF